MKFLFNQENLKFAFFAYLFHICFLTSLSQCLYFLIHYSRNTTIILLGYFSFSVIVVIASFSRKFRQFYLTLIFNEISVKSILKLKEMLTRAQKNSPYTCFILFHFYIAFSIFHLLMLYFYTIDVPFEIVYQLLNLIRLFFFPVILVMVVLTFFPDFFKMEGVFLEASAQLLQKITSSFLEFVQEMGSVKKNPKTAACIYSAAATGAVAVGHKHTLQQQFHQTTEKLGLDFADVPLSIADNPASCELYRSALHTISQIDRPALNVLALDIKNFFSRNPTLQQELAENLTKFKAAEALAQAKRQQSLEKASEIGFSPLARASTDAKIDPSTSVVSKIPTILEKVVVEFFQ